MLKLLEELRNEKVIRNTDFYFAKLMVEKNQSNDEIIQNLVALISALCCFHYAQGNVCLTLENELMRNFFDLSSRKTERNYLAEIQQKIHFILPEKWQEKLKNEKVFTLEPDNFIAPLVFEFNAVYFYRVWQDENDIVKFLVDLQNAGKNCRPLIEKTKIKKRLDHYFGVENKMNWQKVAVAMAIKQPLSIITGGPGTGKTTTVTRLLLMLQELHDCKLHIELVAPTGKAAARLGESIQGELAKWRAKEKVAESAKNEALQQSIPKKARTIHQLLGAQALGDGTRYHQRHKLPIDALVVDETSMIDLSLMAKLIRALKPETRLILLGDPDQLASVESGAVLAEIAQFSSLSYSEAQQDYLKEMDFVLPKQSVQTATPLLQFLRDSLCHLTESHRFTADSGIGAVARLVQAGEAMGSLQAFKQQFTDLNWIAPKKTKSAMLNTIVQSAVENYQHYLRLCRQYRDDLNAENVRAIFAAFNQVRYLCALRGGELGVENLNLVIANALREKGLVQFRQAQDWYLGKPIMVLENDRNVGLNNGEIGLCLTPDKVFFDEKSVATARIPAHESAFAMTIHKSQGSEFKHTLLVLPDEISPILSRELIFTGVTRARDQLTVFSAESIWTAAVKKPVQRQSGLGERLKAKRDDKAI